MKVRKACVCLDCDEIFEGSGSDIRCPVCASRCNAFLARWLLPLVAQEAPKTDAREVGCAN